MNATLKPWHALLGIKRRAIERMERTLSEQRRQLRQCQTELQKKEQALDRCHAQCTEHDQQLTARIMAGQGISALLYLDYALYRQTLLDQIKEATLARDSAEQNVSVKQEELCASQRMIGKMNQQRDLIDEKILALNQALAQAQEIDHDEESAESSLSRHMQARRALAQEAGA